MMTDYQTKRLENMRKLKPSLMSPVEADELRKLEKLAAEPETPLPDREAELKELFSKPKEKRNK